jgi:1-aminocyclopropane-1-carboxylate deaminase/D-cysteine desulfhydrase-like pyridoxal-dependent ACC family enzyme
MMSHYPGLDEKIRAVLSPCCLGVWPTPLEQAPALGEAVGLAALWVKREDQSSPHYGGNKVRGLEFLLAGLARGTACATVGGTGSTHCLATAVHARRQGIYPVLAQFPQPPTPASQAVARVTAALATRVFVARSRATVPLVMVRAWHHARRLGPSRWIAGGGAAAPAVVGHVLAALELGQQLDSPPDAVVLPIGTGGTAAGVALGLAALGWRTRVIAVRVAPRVVANRWRAMRLATAARRLLASRGLTLPEPDPMAIVNGLGRGYGYPTPAGEAALALAAQHGFVLDSTYSAKAFAALQHVAGDARRVIFWHTFSHP